jgi:hypothetical protein
MILALFSGRDDIPFQQTWEGTPGWTRSFASFSSMADEEVLNRTIETERGRIQSPRRF